MSFEVTPRELKLCTNNAFRKYVAVRWHCHNIHKPFASGATQLKFCNRASVYEFDRYSSKHRLMRLLEAYVSIISFIASPFSSPQNA